MQHSATIVSGSRAYDHVDANRRNPKVLMDLLNIASIQIVSVIDGKCLITKTKYYTRSTLFIMAVGINIIMGSWFGFYGLLNSLKQPLLAGFRVRGYHFPQNSEMTEEEP